MPGQEAGETKFPTFNLVWLIPEAQKWWPSTWPNLSGQGVLDLLGKAEFGQENCKQSWIFKQV